jgi:hypothetical protein
MPNTRQLGLEWLPTLGETPVVVVGGSASDSPAAPCVRSPEYCSSHGLVEKRLTDFTAGGAFYP